MAVKAYLQVTMRIPEKNRKAAAKVYTDCHAPFSKIYKTTIYFNLARVIYTDFSKEVI